jgi:hypothetical protein
LGHEAPDEALNALQRDGWELASANSVNEVDGLVHYLFLYRAAQDGERSQ